MLGAPPSSPAYIHADNTDLFNSVEMIVGNDGGVQVRTNFGNYPVAGYNVTQFYSMGLVDLVRLAGAQDNGTLYKDNSCLGKGIQRS